MKKLLTLALALALVLCVATASAVTLQLSEGHPQSHPVTMADQEFARLVEERTEGRIKIEIYSNSTLYREEFGAIEALQLGDLAFARVSSVPVASYVPLMNVMRLPYLYKNADHMWAILDGEIGQSMLAEVQISGSGLVALCWYDVGASSFYTNKLVTSLGDLIGLKIRVQDSDMMVDMVSVLGATGLADIGLNEVYSQIMLGTIDGAENNWLMYQNMGDYEAAPYYMLDQHTRVPEILLASEIVLAGLDEDDVEIIKQCAKEAQEYEKAEWTKKEAEVEQIVRDAGCTIMELSAEAYAEFQNAMTMPSDMLGGVSLYEKYGAKYQDIIDSIRVVGENY